MNTVTIADNVFDPTSWETVHDVPNVCEFLLQRYSKMPDNGRIYFKHVADNCEVTPHNEAEIDRLLQLEGHFFVMIYPEGIELIGIIIMLVLAAVSIGLAFLLRPQDKPAGESPNNSLTDRSNTQRPMQRIPDIVGNVRAYPDLIQVPYKIFIGGQEVEYDFMCVGRGYYQVTLTAETVGSVDTGAIAYDIKEDQTFVEEIAENIVEIYDPYTSPNSGDEPALRVGTGAINEPCRNIYRSNSVDGQILRPPNDTSYTGYQNTLRFTAAGTIECDDNDVDLTQWFGAGDYLGVYNGIAHDPGNVYPSVSLSGTYFVAAVNANSVTLVNPQSVTTNWNALANFAGEVSTWCAPTLDVSGSRVVGPFILDVENLTEVWANFVAPGGLFKVSNSSGNQYQINVTCELRVQALDANYAPVGGIQTAQGTVYGSAVLQNMRGGTIKFALPSRTDGKLPGRVQCWAVRTNGTDTTWKGTNADQIQWRDLYAVSEVPLEHFGNVTTIQTMTYATASALVAQERKLNLDVTRRLPMLDAVTHEPVPAATMKVSGQFLRIPNFGTEFLYQVDIANFPAGTPPTGTITGSISYGDIVTTYRNDHSPFGAQVNDYNDALAQADGAIGAIFSVKYSGDANYRGWTKRIVVSDNVTGFSFGETTFPTNVKATTNAADIIVALAIDPYIGNRQTSELDYNGIYGALGVGGEADTYFNSPYCTQFCYTFDDSNTSFEEMMADIQQACFSTIYRRGSLLSVYFEKLTHQSTLLFNHRNKVPGSETRTVTFGLVNNYDGIALDFIDPNAPNYPDIETTITYYFPPGDNGDLTSPGASLAPKKIKALGVRNNVQAAKLGWRMYQMMLYGNTATEFEATHESALVINRQRILVADNTRPDVIDGDVEDQFGLVVTLSQPFSPVAGKDYVGFFQHYDGSVEAIPLSGVAGDPYKVLLSRAPVMPLVIDYAKRRSFYQIAGPDNIFLDGIEVTPTYNPTYNLTQLAFSAPATTDGIKVGDQVILINLIATNEDGSLQQSVSGTFGVVGIAGDTLTLDGDWSFIEAWAGGVSQTVGCSIKVIKDASTQATPFLLTDKEPQNNMLFKVTAQNYDDRYYIHDFDDIELNGSDPGDPAGFPPGSDDPGPGSGIYSSSGSDSISISSSVGSVYSPSYSPSPSVSSSDSDSTSESDSTSSSEGSSDGSSGGGDEDGQQ